MRRVEEDTVHFTIAARFHAGAAAQSLLIVLAELDGDIPIGGGQGGAASAELLVAELASIGVALKSPELGLLARAGVLILKYFREQKRS